MFCLRRKKKQWNWLQKCCANQQLSTVHSSQIVKVKHNELCFYFSTIRKFLFFLFMHGNWFAESFQCKHHSIVVICHCMPFTHYFHYLLTKTIGNSNKILIVLQYYCCHYSLNWFFYHSISTPVSPCFEFPMSSNRF